MAAVIGSDILDIGSRKARRQREDLVAPGFAFGAPGQFDLPNVADVGHITLADSCIQMIDLTIRFLSHFLLSFPFYFSSCLHSYNHSPPPIAAATLPRFVELVTKINRSSS